MLAIVFVMLIDLSALYLLYSVMIEHYSPRRGRPWSLKYFCTSNTAVCTCFGLNCCTWIVLHWMENMKLFIMWNINHIVYCLSQFWSWLSVHYNCLVVLNNVWECVRCHWFTRNGVGICSIALQLSFSVSCMLSGLNYNHLQRIVSYSVVPETGEVLWSNMTSTIDSTSWSAPPEECLLQNMT